MANVFYVFNAAYSLCIFYSVKIKNHIMKRVCTLNKLSIFIFSPFNLRKPQVKFYIISSRKQNNSLFREKKNKKKMAYIFSASSS